MGYTQYWKHGTYRLDNGTYEDIGRLLLVSIEDAKAIVGDDAVNEYVGDRRFVFRLVDVFRFEAMSRHYIRSNSFGETAVFFDDEKAMFAWNYLYDIDVDDLSYKEFCKPDGNELADAMLCAILIAIATNNPDADISSDGTWDEPNWQAGAKLYEKACDRKAECPRLVALECMRFVKGDSPAYVHVYKDSADVYAPYDKKLSGNYTSAEDAIATLAVHGYEAM